MKNYKKELEQHLKDLHLPTIRSIYDEAGEKAAAEGLDYSEYLLELARSESENRRQRRTERWLSESQLPLEKNLESFEMQRMSKQVIHQAKVLQEGSFLDRNENILAFGNPGSGKTHLLCGIGQHLVYQGHRIYSLPVNFLSRSCCEPKRI